MQNLNTNGTEKYQQSAEVGMKLARERMYHRGKSGKTEPLCLACGQPATNELPSCNDPKCRKVVRPVFHWATRVSGLTLTKGVRVRRSLAA